MPNIRDGNEYAPWLPEQDANLREIYRKYLSSGKTDTFAYSGFLQQMGEAFGRKPSAIRSRLKKLFPYYTSLATGSTEALPEKKPVAPPAAVVPPKPKLQWGPGAQNALQLLEDSNDHLFITGQAGTGKSTLLNEFRRATEKNFVVLAPTGVAAVNVGGKTIHSFCGLSPSSSMRNAKLLPEGDDHREVVNNLEIVFIDEVSMARADLIDYLDKFLRLNRESAEPFGGVRIIMIGDLYQLPPVLTRDEEQVFAQAYDTPYFFSARVFQNVNFRFVELEVVYRQQDGKFLEILRNIRNNTATRDDLAVLNNRVMAEGSDQKDDYTIYLTATNAIANSVNEQRLAQLNQVEKKCKASINGSMEGFQMPAELELKLKVGAQVMMLNNDPAGRWINGTVGKVIKIQVTERDASGMLSKDDKLVIKMEDGSVQYVTRNSWDILDYTWDETARSIEPKIIGNYTQFPVRLAWAVTIHKSQGKTFDTVIVDLGRGAFAHGQLYVALSRCRTLEGIRLKNPVRPIDIRMDERVIAFLKYCEEMEGDPVAWRPGVLF